MRFQEVVVAVLAFSIVGNSLPVPGSIDADHALTRRMPPKKKGGTTSGGNANPKSGGRGTSGTVNTPVAPVNSPISTPGVPPTVAGSSSTSISDKIYPGAKDITLNGKTYVSMQHPSAPDRDRRPNSKDVMVEYPGMAGPYIAEPGKVPFLTGLTSPGSHLVQVEHIVETQTYTLFFPWLEKQPGWDMARIEAIFTANHDTEYFFLNDIQKAARLTPAKFETNDYKGSLLQCALYEFGNFEHLNRLAVLTSRTNMRKGVFWGDSSTQATGLEDALDLMRIDVYQKATEKGWCDTISGVHKVFKDFRNARKNPVTTQTPGAPAGPALPVRPKIPPTVGAQQQVPVPQTPPKQSTKSGKSLRGGGTKPDYTHDPLADAGLGEATPEKPSTQATPRQDQIYKEPLPRTKKQGSSDVIVEFINGQVNKYEKDLQSAIKDMAKSTTVAANPVIKAQLKSYKVTSAATLKQCAVLLTPITPVDTKLKGATQPTSGGASTPPPGTPGPNPPATPGGKQSGTAGANVQGAAGTKANTQAQQAAMAAAANAVKKANNQKNTQQQTSQQSADTTAKAAAAAAASGRKKGGKL